MIKAIIFDFDGVILETSDIKTEAFRELFKEHSQELVESVIDYHKTNMGISRFVKFQYFYDNILHQELTKEKKDELSEKFSKIALDKILMAPFVKGVKEFLQSKKYKYYIASGTPEEELRFIVKEREVDCYFHGVYGSPRVKEDIVRDIMLNNNYSNHEVVFIGDAISDKLAADKTGIRFIARLDGNNHELFHDIDYKVKDFESFSEGLKVLDSR
ncbi:hypothetical protein BHU72_05300 [Desulfuribacillus stibiiarsenatis]|uniref:Haloacid dehalogenase n=1 Tax=Desulfuribacillus stibiiarsenatis TaxID=1390249 RepID=A0A1E5L674_9FIRM|nr:HAD family hydrolase [Desulfuribacillus stibiiarsenatis]OEH85503.1 hypothetical protein BHU72_05300 [Desulfuribacillus stibiiarsenatis]